MSGTTCSWMLSLSVIICVCFLEESRTDGKNGTLRIIHAFFRHGDRTPLKAYYKDPYNNLSYWPEGWGQLTNAGKLRMYRLGQHFRCLYKDFIPEEFKIQDIYAYSTDKSRTIMSAESFLTGLYPPEKQQVWLQGMPWQPIPVHIMPTDTDPFYPSSKCPRALTELERIQNIPKVKEMFKEYSKLIRLLEKETGQSLPSFLELSLLFDTLKTEKENNMTLPSWTEGVLPEKMNNLAKVVYRILVFNTELKRLRAGPTLGSVVKSFQNYRYRDDTFPSSSHSLFLYFLHDINILVMGDALNLFTPFHPIYGTTLIFELHQVSERSFAVKMKLLNDTKQEPKVLVMPGCGEMCPLDYFVNVTLPLIPQDWKAECQFPGHYSSRQRNAASLWIFNLCLFFISLLIIAIEVIY